MPWAMIIPSLISAGGAIGSSIMGANAANSSAMYNYYINEQNRLAAERERQESIARSDQYRTEDILRGERIRSEDVARADRYRTEDTLRSDQIRVQEVGRQDRARREDLSRADRMRAEDLSRQDVANLLQRAMAERVYKAQTAAQTNSRGDKTEYIEGVGWVTTPSEMTRTLQNAQDNEQHKRLTTDAMRMRREAEANERRRLDEGASAKALKVQLEQNAPTNRSAIRDVLLRRAVEGATQAFDDAQENAARTAIRTGTPNNELISMLARQRAKAATDAQVNAETASYGVADQVEGNRVGRLSSLYNMFAQRAANVDNVSLPVTDYAAAGDAAVANARGSSANAGNALVASMGKAAQSNIVGPTGTQSVGAAPIGQYNVGNPSPVYVQPVDNSGGRYTPMPTNNANALAFGSIASALSGSMDNYFTRQQNADLMDMFKNYYGTGQSRYNDSGSFGSRRDYA